MNKTVLSFLIIPLLFTVFLIGLPFNIQKVKASNGIIYIRADGSVDPQTASISTFDNVTYTFTDNIFDSIVVERDNIVIDGHGYKLQAPIEGIGEGIFLAERSNVTITRMEIEAFERGIELDFSSNNWISGNNITNSGHGIWLSFSSNNTIIGNKIGPNYWNGLVFGDSSNNNITGNQIVANYDGGIHLSSSNSNTMSGNNITNSVSGEGILLRESSENNSITGNNITDNYIGIAIDDSPNNVLRSNSMADCGTSLRVSGSDVSSFINDVDVSNTVAGKPVHYWINKQDMAVPLDAGSVVLVNCTSMTIQSLNLSEGGQVTLLAYTTNSTLTKNNVANGSGINLWLSSNNTMTGNNITSNSDGIWLYSSANNKIIENYIVDNARGICLVSSSNNRIVGNNITESLWCNIDFIDSSNNSISGNTIAGNGNSHGIFLEYSSNHNSITGNNIVNNDVGILTGDTVNNTIFHNVFIKNGRHASTNPMYPNVWDDGYPSGGNYWGVRSIPVYPYKGVDLFRGQGQNQAGSDGIGDSPYEILDPLPSENNTDHYPLMGTFSNFNATSEHHVQTVCNSTISDIQYNGTAISFNVSGENDTIGFCRICIPTDLMNGSYTVFVNGTEVDYDLLPCSNSTHSYLYFTYELSTKEVVIIPEFPTFLILPLFMLLTLPVTIIYRRKHRV